MKEETKRKRERVKELKEQGLSYEEISRETGYKVKTVREYLKVKGSVKHADDYADEIREMYEAGRTISEIAEKIGMSYNGIRDWLVKKGLSTARERNHYAQSEKKEQEIMENLTYAEPRKPKCELVYAGGRVYRDVTAVYAGW